jgi:hypothetical protein
MDAIWGFQRLWVCNTSAKHEKARDKSDHANGQVQRAREGLLLRAIGPACTYSVGEKASMTSVDKCLSPIPSFSFSLRGTCPALGFPEVWALE